VYAERVAGGRYVKVDIDRLKAARYGLNIADVQAVLATAVGGMDVGQTIEGESDIQSIYAIHKAIATQSLV
jgi:Cu(I)/Ag(I) efflux system membrane protein CusA/SilA